jgi:hypothetical protein
VFKDPIRVTVRDVSVKNARRRRYLDGKSTISNEKFDVFVKNSIRRSSRLGDGFSVKQVKEIQVYDFRRDL